MGALRLEEEEDKYYTIEEVADKLGVTRFSVYNFMKEKDPKQKLGYVFIGKRRRVPSSELKRYVQENKR